MPIAVFGAVILLNDEALANPKEQIHQYEAGRSLLITPKAELDSQRSPMMESL